MPRTRIKICGVRDEDALFAAADAGADAVGFVFHPASIRFIEPDDAFDLSAFLPPFVSTVGLFVNAPLEKFIQIEERCPTSFSQLHGQEHESLVRDCGPGVIKAVKFDPLSIALDLARWNALDEVDAILVDGSPGGQGHAFDWAALVEPIKPIKKPIILAGGLTPDNVALAIHTLRPFAVDVSSGVESEPGIKSPEKIHAFCNAVRRADAS